ncbi:ABC transporter permease subunit [Achromobacter xylosoxidans]|uniref:ABC transporter permease subunit n=3 Tax=Alcaligenes xylosoxydans xylosoxydans TaxID=85698 RepID=UPI0006AC003B|nr:ABC transporter permease subunit [Achromobacter xylosoxidans]KOQ23628.1 ABC transporter permease [Achromobacter xylosoxidans]KOQ25122.1 ABC transporter permease [Achromobacter xylosoxidans]KOQ35534.1 ABC transporter permease [Achromobacter xylosoxidans]KOQ43758.1 ABC transporter permease [Achromobacter xylosoxidans]KOQ45275.1 ABC transporter permease [Achromobacter xylosoxidans]
MILLIALKDLRERLRDGRLYWAGGIVAVLLMTALAVGYLHQQEARAEQTAAQNTDYSDWLKQGTRHPHDAAHQGMHVFKPDTTLALLDPGINPYIGSTVWLQAHRQSEVKFRPAQDATGLQRFGDLSAAWILQALGPLLVIVLGFNAFSGEREQGILRQTLSLGVAPWRLLWGKATALALSLGLLLVPAALAAIVAVWLAGGRADALWRFGVLAGGYAVYLAAFIFVTLGVSAAARSSRVAITVLLALWIANTVIAPRVMAELSRGLYPSPTRLEFNQALQDDLKATSDRVWMQAFGTTERWSRDVPLNQWGLALKLDDQSSYAVYDRHFGHLWDTWERQQAVQESAGWLMPLLAVRALSAAMAGTDFAHHRDFTTAAEQQRRVIQDIVSADLVAHADTLEHQHFSYQANPSLWARVPPFRYQPPAAGWALHQARLSLLMLAAALLLSVAFAWRAVARQTAL